MPSPLAARELTKTSHPSALIFRPKRFFLGLIAGACVLMTGALLTACSPKSEGGSADQAAQLAQMADKKMTVYAPRPSAPSAEVQNLTRSRREVAEERVMAAAAPAPAVEVAGSPAAQSAPMEGANQRFLAVRHHMQIETAAAELADLWGAVKARCEQLDCQVEASALQRETVHSAGSAYLTMRVNPRDFAMLTGALGTRAKVLNHQTSSEDKTGEVVDVEAQIKNRSEYRDSLRELLREKDVKRKLTDLMEIRDTLSQVQAEIDAAQAQRKLLEKETAKQFVQMQFQPQQVVISGTYSPWLQTWEGAWNALTGSAQSMVIATAALLPWVIVLGGLLWVIVAIVRTVARIRRRSQVKAEATAAAA